MNTKPSTDDDKPMTRTERAADFYKAYEEYNTALRQWLVAFGIGGPVFLVANDRVAKALAESGNLRIVVTCFLLGAAAQVMIAFGNKVAMWQLYNFNQEKRVQQTPFDKAADWFAKQFWLDALFDLTSIAVYGVAIGLVATPLL